jgi:hypothetical protein
LPSISLPADDLGDYPGALSSPVSLPAIGFCVGLFTFAMAKMGIGVMEEEIGDAEYIRRLAVEMEDRRRIAAEHLARAAVLEEALRSLVNG